MCGITAGVAKRDIASILMDGLKRLEYRGYDSAGLAILNAEQQLVRIRTKGKVGQLSQALSTDPLSGHVGVAHTRWATHGKPSEENAHPHFSGDRLAVVHNGIIENFADLKQELGQKDFEFHSETDTEVIVHAIQDFLNQGQSFKEAMCSTVGALKGAYALAVVSQAHPDRLMVARYGSPLVIGVGDGERFVASDPLALLGITQSFVYLEEGDIAEVFSDRVNIWDKAGQAVERNVRHIDVSEESAQRGHYRHFMQKEIFEQPLAIQSTLAGRLGPDALMSDMFGKGAADAFGQTQQVQIVGCGTSYHAGLIARYWLETLAGTPCFVDTASELRYMGKRVIPDTLLVALSQSGETADTLAAVKHSKTEPFSARLAISNIAQSALVRESDYSLLIKSGPEIGVASTKTFISTLSALLMFVAELGRLHHLSKTDYASVVQGLSQLSESIASVLTLDKDIEQLASYFQDKKHALYLGRGAFYPVMMEGALKLKEISYIHAEAYPAGELKHGPLALVDKDMPVVVMVPNDPMVDKIKSNIQEVSARGGELFVFAEEGVDIESSDTLHVIQMPTVNPIIAPIVYSVPLQLLAYHVAVLKGTDVDQPRNLAKSVTVE